MPLLRTFFLAASFAALLAGCTPSLSPAQEAIKQQLVGTWLSDTDAQGVKTRTVIEVGADGKFSEFEKVIAAQGKTGSVSYTGEWLYDGVNFKRKYMAKDGELLTKANFGYASYALSMPDKDTLFGVDSVKHRSIRLVRAGPGERP